MNDSRAGPYVGLSWISARDVERRRRRVQATLTPRTTALTSRTTHALCRNDWMLSLRRTRWILNIHSRLRPHLPQRPTRYTFGTLNHKDLEIYYDDTDKGHDTFILGREITRLYYILGGSGYFTIDNRTYDLSVCSRKCHQRSNILIQAA